MRKLFLFSILVAVTMTFMTVQSAEATSLSATVQGKQTVYFAGRTLDQLQDIAIANGITDFNAFPFYGDLDDPDTLPDAIDITGLGSLISISASGLWSHTPTLGSGPQGNGVFEVTQPEYGIFGISLLGADLNMLAGVFLCSDLLPDPGATPPSLTLEDDMTTPMLNQAFAIGAELAEITVPTGANLLYLGLHNGYEWTNNSGSVDVTISGVPEPSTILLIGTGLVGLVGFRRKFRK